MSNLHAHISTATVDCDGPLYREYTEKLTKKERKESKKDVNDFHEIHFKERVIANIMSIYSEAGTLTVRRTEVRWYETTDEGHRSSEAVWCEDKACNKYTYSQRDVYAEMMGY